jgi:hypothetical protein
MCSYKTIFTIRHDPSSPSPCDGGVLASERGMGGRGERTATLTPRRLGCYHALGGQAIMLTTIRISVNSQQQQPDVRSG